jgi:hypothetical protein
MAWALLTVFQVITGENWNEVMLTHMQIDPVSILYIMKMKNYDFILIFVFLFFFWSIHITKYIFSYIIGK